MTREEAIRCLSVHSSTNGSGLCTDEQHYEAKQMAIKALEQEPSNDMVSRGVFEQVMWERDVALNQLKELGYGLGEKPKTGHWIPVSEKLPKEGKEVLTCSNGGFIEIQSFENSHGNIYWENQNGDWTDIDEVIAWMPLPKPYKAESEE